MPCKSLQCMTTSKDVREFVSIFGLKVFLPKFNEAPQCTFGDNNSMCPCLIRLPVCAVNEADCKAVALIRANPDSWNEH